MVKKEVIPVEERNVRKLLDAWLEYNFSLLLKELSTNPLGLPEKPAPDYSKNSINLKSNPKWMTSDELRMARKTCSGLELKAVNDELRNYGVELKHKYIRREGSPGDYTYVYTEPKDEAGKVEPETEGSKKTSDWLSDIPNMSNEDFFKASDILEEMKKNPVYRETAKEYLELFDKELTRRSNEASKKQEEERQQELSKLHKTEIIDSSKIKIPKNIPSKTLNRSELKEYIEDKCGGDTYARSIFGDKEFNENEFLKSESIDEFVENKPKTLKEAQDLIDTWGLSAEAVRFKDIGVKPEFGSKFGIKYNGVNALQMYDEFMMPGNLVVIFEGKHLGSNQHGDGFVIKPEKIKEVIRVKEPEKKVHETEKKSLDLQAGLDWIKKKILNFFQITLPMKDIINENVASSFLKGSKLASRQVNTQFSPNLQALKASQELTYNEINNMNSELREDIKRLFEREILAGSSSRKIEEELRKLKGFKSNNNIKAISRTELHRSYGTGWNSMLKDIGFDGDKQWSAVIDKRTSELCKANNKQTVPFDKPFKDLRTGEEVGMHNPFHINCFDDKTMVLTNNGFKFFNDLMFEDTILSLNPETLTTEYLKPVEYIKQEFRGLMYLYERGMVNFCVTPHHSNVVVKNRRVVLKETVNLSEIEEFLLSETKKTIIRKTDFKQVEYDGFVYDVELPKHHILFVKRFGEGMWSGNCRCTTVAIPRGVKLATQEEIRKELAKQTEQITASYRKT